MKTQLNTHKKIVLFGSTSLLIAATLFGAAFAGAKKADFNGDGLEDLVVAVPHEDIGTRYNAGAVKVVYGRADGTWRPHSDTVYLHQGLYGEPGISLGDPAETSDQVGGGMEVGDFNDDGYSDLAVSVPYEDVNGRYNYGLVHVVYGSPSGLNTYNKHELGLHRYNLGEFRDNARYFGRGMAVGDYDADGIDDLAVGFLGTKVDGIDYDGGAILFFGRTGYGLKYAEWNTKTHVVRPTGKSVDSLDQFGYTLVSGYFNNDEFADLAIAAPSEKVSGIRAGTVRIAWGRSDWNAGPYWLTKINPQVKNEYARFGHALAAGNLDANSRDELVIGMPGSNFSMKKDGGLVSVANVLLDGRVVQSLFFQSQNILPGSTGVGDRFGQSLTIADFNGDKRDDLAIGIPGKSKGASLTDWNGIPKHGAVMVMYGNGTWLNNFEVWHQDSAGVAGGREDYDYFGWSLSSGDFNNDGKTDLLVGAPYEDIGSIRDAGSVQFIWGRSSGLTTAISGQQLFHQGSFSDPGFGTAENEAYDRFGMALLP